MSIPIRKKMGLLTAIMPAMVLILFLQASPAYAATAWTVTNGNDDAGSATDITLRYAMTHAQSGDTINFAGNITGQCYYTTDGSDPRTSSTRVAYSSPISVFQSETIKAANYNSSNGWSDVTSASFSIGSTSLAAAPVIFPAGGSFTSTQTVTITVPEGQGNDVIFYTTDGSDPRTSSTYMHYSGPILVSRSETIRAVVLEPLSGTTFSDSASAVFSFNGITSNQEPPQEPVISSLGGSFTNTQTVAIYDRAGTISLSSPLPAINNKDLTIRGPGASLLAIDGNHLFRVFEVCGSNASIYGLTVENGRAVGANGTNGDDGIGGGGGGGGAAGGGGGLLIKGADNIQTMKTVLVDGVVFRNNHAVGGNGGNGGNGWNSSGTGVGGNGGTSDLHAQSVGGTGHSSVDNYTSETPGYYYGGGGGGYGRYDTSILNNFSLGGNGDGDHPGSSGTAAPNNKNSNGTRGGNGGTGGYYGGNIDGAYGGNGGNGGDGYGGAICMIFGSLNINNCSFINNSATGGNGGLPGYSDYAQGTYHDFYWGCGGNGGNGDGGAIYLSKLLNPICKVTIVDTSFSGSTAHGGAGGYATSVFNGSFIGAAGEYWAHDIGTYGQPTIYAKNISGATSYNVDLKQFPETSLAAFYAIPELVTADGAASSTITVCVFESESLQPLSGDIVTLSQGGGNSTISPVSAITDSTGTATFTVTNTKAEAVTYTASDLSGVLKGAGGPRTFTVTFTPGLPDPGQSTVTASPASVTSDGTTTSTVTVTLKDVCGNLVGSGKTVTLSQGSGSSQITPVNSGITDSNSIATFTVTDNVAETVTYTARDTTDNVTVAQAATVTFTPFLWVVDSLNDNSNRGTLRYAIANAPAGTTITFLSGLAGTITLQSPLPAINKDLTIDGPGAGVLTIDGSDRYRIFEVNGGTVSIKGLTIADGTAAGSNGANGSETGIGGQNGGSGSGGGLLVNGAAVSIESVIFNNNRAIGGSGGNGYRKTGGGDGGLGGDGGSGFGGAICLTNGSLTITDSKFNGNRATGGDGGAGCDGGEYGGNGGSGGNGYGGAVFVNGGSLTVSNSQFSNDEATGGSGRNGGNGTVMASYGGYGSGGNGGYGSGGAIFVNAGSLTVTGSQFSSHKATGGNGGNGVGGGNGADGRGGVIFNSTGLLTITDSQFSGNSVFGGSGGIVSHGSGIGGGSVGGSAVGNDLYNRSGTVMVNNVTFGPGNNSYYNLPSICTATFDSQGGSTVISISTSPGSAINAPTAPTWPGYIFDGWYRESTCTNAWSFSTDTVTGDITLYAKWTVDIRVPCTVSVSANPSEGGSVSGGGSYYEGDSVTVTATSNNDYTFVDWTEGGMQVCTDSAYTFTMGTADRGLTANFAANLTYTVAFETFGGSPVASIYNVNPGSYISEPAAPTLTGYQFYAWYTDDNIRWNFLSDRVTGNITLHAIWIYIQPAIYQVYLLADPPEGGSVSGANFYLAGSSVTVKATPNNGYTFVGWTEGSTQITTNPVYTFTLVWNSTLVANFRRTYSIDPISNYGMTVLTEGYASGTQETKTITIARSGQGDLTNLAVALRQFGPADGFEITQPDVTTLNAETPSTTFTIKAKDGLEAGDYEAMVTVSADSMTGVTFWVTQKVIPASVVSAAISPTMGDFDKNPVNQADVSTDITWHDAASVTDIKKSGVSVGAGVYSVSDNTLTIKQGYLETQAVGPLVLTVEFDRGDAATWTISISDTTPDPSATYSVTYNANGGEDTAPTESDKIAGSIFAAANNTFTPPSGKKFKHWYTNPLGADGTAYAQGATVTMPANALILYAIWEDESADAYTVIFNTQGGSTVASESVNYNSTFTQPIDPTRTGYTFAGWYKEDTCTNPWNFDTDTVTGDTTLYAGWMAVSYTLTYNLDGGAVSPANPVSYTIESDAVTLNNPTKPVHTFTGWSGPDITGTSMSIVIPKGSTGNRSYTAHWAAVPTTGMVTGTVTDGANPVSGANVSLTVSGSVYSATTLADGSYSILNVPAGTGYTVTASKSGYTSGNAANVSVTANTTTPDINITLTAAVTLLSATADGVSDTTTSTKIGLTFDTAITGLTAGDITITDGTGAAVKGTLTGGGTSWSIALTSVTTQGDVTVAVAAPTGYTISGSPKTVAVYKPVVQTVTVTSVTVAPPTVSVQKGTTQTFTAAVNGTNNPAQTVTWSVYGNTSVSTNINASGLLTVAADETAATLTVTATSTVDNNKSGTATVTVTTTPPAFAAVTDITGVPATATAGTPLTLTGTVAPANATNQTVVWSVYNTGGTGASIVGNTLSTAVAGIVVVRATITNGLTESTDYTQDFNITVAAAPVTTYTVTASADIGGSISPSGIVNVAEGSSQTFTITSNSGYRINSVTVDGVNQGAITTYTLTNVTASHTITATFTRTSGGGDGSPPTPATPAAPTYNADVKAGNSNETTLLVTVDKDKGTASTDVGSQKLTSSGTVITVPSIPDVNSYSVGIPVLNLSTSDIQGTLTLHTEDGSITVPSNMLTGVSDISGSKAEITIGQGNKENLPEDVKAAIGDKPLIQLTLSIDGKQADWNNRNAPVTVSIPYTPTATELANPESIVVWYIDGSGKVVTIPNGHYDPATGRITFATTHFSDYAVAYNPVSFNDVAAGAWYNKAVGFIAARGITSGTGSGKYSPEAKLTRGEFIVLIMRAYGIPPDTDLANNFSDAGNTYYAGYLAAAKRLGISGGVGNNMYAPGNEITRQEMFTLLYNVLKVIGQLPQGDSGKSLSNFSDAGQIASWAKDAMTLLVETGTIGGNKGMLTPKSTTTRAEMAQVVYNLLSK